MTPLAGRCALLCAFLSSGAFAAVPDSTAHLTLEAALRATVDASPTVQLAERQVAGAEGAWLAASDVFGLHVETYAGGDRVHSVVQDATAASGLLALESRSTSYGVQMLRRFRSGARWTQDVQVSRSQVGSLESTGFGQASVNGSLVVPLVHDRGGVVSEAPERAAEAVFNASRLERDHAVARSVFATAVAYWDYVAALERLRVFASTEERAERMVSDTRVLVEAEERTKADLTQVLANRASKRAARIAAEQEVVGARQRLGLAIGLPAERILALPPPSTELPPIPADSLAPLETERLVRAALASRYDVAAQERRREAAGVVSEAALRDRDTHLDLVLGAGYTGTLAGLPARRVFTPLYRNVPGPDLSVQVRYALPGAGAGLRGVALQQQARYESERIASADLERQVRTGVAVAATALASSRQAHRESQSAVDLFAATVRSEQRKFQLGVSTLFDVIQAEDGLTSARLSAIASHVSYAIALAQLRYEMGQIARRDVDANDVRLADLLTPP